MKKKKVILIEYSPSLPVEYTINMLKTSALALPEIKEKFDIECHSITADQFPFEKSVEVHVRKDNALLCELLEKKPVIIGMSIYVWNYNFFSRLTKLLKLMNNNCKVIWGGKLVTNNQEVVISENPDVDCFCIGEGELVFRNYLLRFLDKDGIIEPLAGTVMNINGKFVKSHLPAPVPDIGDLPNPYIEKLINPQSVLMANIETLRGCVFKCSYCDWGGENKNYRIFSDEYVCKVIKAILDQKFENVFFMDSVFAMKPSRRKLFLETILNNYNNHTVFAFELMLEMLDDDTMHLFRQLDKVGGLAKIEVGIQSLNKKTLKSIRRHLNLEKFIERYHSIIRNASGVQDKIQIDLIIGLPEESTDSFKEGFNFVFSLDSGKITVFPLEIFPGSEIDSLEMRDEYKIKSLQVSPYSITSCSSMNAFEIQKLNVLTWVITSLRTVLRKSIFYLHHMMNENIFDWMIEYSNWCQKKGYVISWYSYSSIEDHIIWFVEYINSDEFNPFVGDLKCLKHTLLYELAPFMLTKNKEKELSVLWENPKNNLDANNYNNSDKINQSNGKFLIWCDRVVKFNTHPETNFEVLNNDGNGIGLYIEVYGNSFRKEYINQETFEAVLNKLDNHNVFVAK